MTVASAYGHWSATAQEPIAGPGAAEGFRIEAAAAQFTLPDESYFNPLAIGVPITVSDRTFSETIVALGVSCPPPDKPAPSPPTLPIPILGASKFRADRCLLE